MIDGQKGVKARLVVRGFKDFQADDLNTSASTASRWGQRIVNQAVVENKWELFSFDVSTAFLQGLTFEEMYKMGFTNKREVCLEIPKGSLQLIRELPGMSDFDPDKHVLRMLKGGFGLKDAPRMWRIRLGQELEKLGLKPLQADNPFTANGIWSGHSTPNWY